MDFNDWAIIAIAAPLCCGAILRIVYMVGLSNGMEQEKQRALKRHIMAMTPEQRCDVTKKFLRQD